LSDRSQTDLVDYGNIIR